MASSRGAVERTNHIRIVHDIPGRLRLRLSAIVESDALVDAVRALTGVESCHWSPLTRTLLVVYGPETPADAILQMIRDTTGEGVFAETPPGRGATGADRPTLSAAVSGAAGELDRRMRQATRDTVGLGGIVPAALAIWAVRELMLGRAAPLAWSTALWYAHGLFRDYNTPPP